MEHADILVKGKDGQRYITLERAIKLYDIEYNDGGKRLALTNKPLILEYPGFTIELRNITTSD